ncbi:hypothetical protein ASPNIDRAFT_35595 [Aspergillus niger ATCC 1015]|uniref:Carrier domain-containing protein n=1 Tax=Aspergillus niger (strain ATCC 1015 / CBS 113.46 / FGSC A1144 / LSHB Ac4 / NCTC 3858a / NRRL 328 / USDA 3528.7) TaxID=380704 RepID=G3XR68_ASPNA|nr:hypothetical protein ASPNIDRAFT_35595 [Aspergillus niger ATCC 1015]
MIKPEKEARFQDFVYLDFQTSFPGQISNTCHDDSGSIHPSIRVALKKYETAFSPQKCNLMAGGLGGLTRSISTWMISCGARRFVFLSRSGNDKPQAKNLVEYLQAQVAYVTVIRGDVCRYEDVERAVEVGDYPTGGVIQTAIALDETIWSDMPHSAWRTTMSSKVQGTWNLHNALRQNGRDSQLDFFVMTSSISGTVGTATESNYCAANSFLDAFARHILTGVEFTGLQEQRERGFEGDNHVLADPRAAIFTASFARRAAGEGKRETRNATAHLPKNIARALRDNQDVESNLDALRAVVSKKISNLILLPESDLQANQPLGDSGLDSMLAAEFRTFIFRMFEVDIPFVVLLKRSTIVNLLTDMIAQGLQAGT